MTDSFWKRGSIRISVIFLIFGSLFFALIMGEIILRFFYPQRIYYNISQWDPYVGFNYIPNIEGYSKTKDYIMQVKINSRGLRDREFNYMKPPNTIRIGIFGDSFTFGEGVQDNETYPKILEHLFINDEKTIQSISSVEVLNFGIGKTGTSHQLAWYQKEGRKYQLDFVILGFLSGNDFEDNRNGVFYLRNDKLIHDPKAYSSIRKIQKIVNSIPFYRWLATHSHLVNLLRKAATMYDDKRRSNQAGNFDKEKDERKNDIDPMKYQLTLKLIEEFQKKTLQNNSGFMVVNLPAKRQKVLLDYSETERIPSFVYKWETLLKDLNNKKIKVLDLVPVLSSLPESLCYFKNDGHMTKFGHKVVATNIYKVISSDILHKLKAMGNKKENLR